MPSREYESFLTALKSDKAELCIKIVSESPQILAQKDAEGRNILRHAVLEDKPDITAHLANTPELIKERDNQGLTPLHLAVINLAAPEIISQFHEKNKNLIFSEDKKGWTPLHYAVSGNNKSAIAEIKKLCPDTFETLMDMPDRKRLTPRHIEESKRGALSIELDAMAAKYISAIAPEESAKAPSTPPRSRASSSDSLASTVRSDSPESVRSSESSPRGRAGSDDGDVSVMGSPIVNLRKVFESTSPPTGKPPRAMTSIAAKKVTEPSRDGSGPSR